MVRIGGAQWVAHTEFHRKHQSLAVDVAEAQVRLYRREMLPVLSHVWDLYGSRQEAVLQDREMELGAPLSGKASRCVYRRVNLRGMDAEELLARGPKTLWALVPLTRDGATEEMVRKADAAIEAQEDLSPERRADLLTTLLFLAEEENVAMAMLREYITREKLMQSTLYKSILTEGRAEGHADLLLRVLRRHFGVLDDALSQRIRKETRIEVLEDWFDEATAASDLQALGPLIEKIHRIPLPRA